MSERSAPNDATESQIVFGPAWRDQGLWIILFVLLAIFGVVETGRFPWAIQFVDLAIVGVDGMMPIPLFLLIPVLILFGVAHRTFNYCYILAPEYVVQVSGRLSLFRKSQRLRYVHVRGVNIEQNISQRLFNTGNIRLQSTANSTDDDVVLRGVARPEYYKDLINARVGKAIRAMHSAGIED